MRVHISAYTETATELVFEKNYLLPLLLLFSPPLNLLFRKFSKSVRLFCFLLSLKGCTKDHLMCYIVTHTNVAQQSISTAAAAGQAGRYCKSNHLLKDTAREGHDKGRYTYRIIIHCARLLHSLYGHSG